MSAVDVDTLVMEVPLRNCVVALLNHPRDRLNRHLGAVLGRFMSDNALLAPMSTIGRGLEAAHFNPDLGEFIDGVAKSVGLTDLSVHARRTIANLWLCTIEGRRDRIGRDQLVEFLRLHLHPSRYEGQIGGKKWIPGLNPGVQKGVKDLAFQLQVPDLNAKQSKFDNVIADLEATTDGRHWLELWNSWVEERRPGSMPRYEQGLKLLCRYLIDNPQVATVEALLSRRISRTDFIDHCAAAYGQPAKATEQLRIAHGFLEWILAHDERFSAPDELGQDRIVRAEYFNPIRLSKLREMDLGKRQRPAETVQIALPLEYLDEVEVILTENDMAWPKSRNVDWIDAMDPDSGESVKIFCPTLPLLLRLLIKLPLRNGQARRLDSGEGDQVVYDHIGGIWIENRGPHAGYWNNLGVANPQRGVLRKILDSWTGETLCGFYINSNKTADRKTLFDETSGYVISWQNEDAIAIVNEMRAWQEKWNPLEQPTRYIDVREGVFEKMHPSMAKRRPDIFYLFRYPGGLSHRYNDSPPSSQQLRMYWFEVLAELERRLKARGVEAPELISYWKGDSPQASPYALHGLRHSGLTRLAQAGVHPWILKNIVAGHADYVMTLYYIKPNPAHVSAHLNEKYMEALQQKQTEFKQFLASRTLIEVHRLAVSRGPDAFQAVEALRNSVGRSAVVMSSMDHGVCPNGRTKCDEGVKLTDQVRSKKRYMDRLYIPVPNIHGAPDCTQCRFFITGTPFIDGLRVKTNEVSVAASSCAQRYQKMVAEIHELEAERLGLDDPRNMDGIRELRLATLKQQVKTEADAMSVLATSLHSHGEMFQKVRALLKVQANSNQSAVPALLFTEAPKFEWGLLPRFEAIDELVHAAKWFPSVRAEELTQERELEITRMLVRQGAAPIMALLSKDEARDAVDALTAYLYMKLDKASVRKLFAGLVTLESLGIVADVEVTLSKAIGHPIDLLIESRDKPQTKALPESTDYEEDE